MFLKLVIVCILGFYGYFYYQSQLGPLAFTLNKTVVYESENAAMNVSERGVDTVVTKLDANLMVLIVNEMASQSWSVCEIEVDDKIIGWVRCAELQKVMRK